MAWFAFLLLWAIGPVTAPARAEAPWAASARTGSTVYFAFSAPARIERYSLEQSAWLPSIALPAGPTAIHADETGIFIAYDRALVKRDLDGTNEVPVYNSPRTITGILSDGTYLFVSAPSYNQAWVTSLRKSSGAFIDQYSQNYSISAGFSIAPGNRRIFGVNTQSSSFSTIELAYLADGTFGAVKEVWSDTGSYDPNSSTFVSPNEQRLVRQNGIVYDVPGVIYRGSLAGEFDDAVFDGDERLLILRENVVFAYGISLLETGQVTLPGVASRIAVRGEKLHAFIATPGTPQGIGVTVIPLTDIVPPSPGPAVDPEGLEMIPDTILAGPVGTYYFYSADHRSLFQWSAAEAEYVAAIPLTGAPSHVAYSPQLDRVWLGYDTGKINQIDVGLGSVLEEGFTNLPLPVRGLQAVDDLVFAVDDAGAWMTYYTFGDDGAPLDTKEWSYYSEDYIWSASNRRLYHLRDDTSPNDVLYQAIGENGEFGAVADSPYHGEFAVLNPLRVSPDGSQILTGDGIAYDGETLYYAGSIANGVVDAAWIQSGWVTVRDISGTTQVQVWNGSLLQAASYNIPGTPLRIFGMADGRALVFSHSLGHLVFSYVDLAGGGSVTTSPALLSKPSPITAVGRQNVVLSVTVQGAGLQYEWFKNGAVIAGATGSNLTLVSARPSDSGDYHVRISNALGVVVTAPVTVTITRPNMAERPDFDGDGKADVVLQDALTGARSILEMNGLVAKGAALPLWNVPTDWEICGVADLNGDSDADLIWQNVVTGERAFQLLQGRTLTQHLGFGPIDPTWEIAGAGDFNGDQNPDLVWQNLQTGARSIWMLNGTAFSSSAALPNVPLHWSIVGVADFDRDGHADLLWRNRDTGHLVVWLMQGVIHAYSVTMGSASPAWEVSQVSDFNGDGHLDLFWQHRSSGQRAIWLLNGMNYWMTVGTDAQAKSVRSGTSPRVSRPKLDFNNDGFADMLWQNPVTGERGYWAMTGANVVSNLVPLGTIPTAWSIAATADLNRDGHTDLVWQNVETGQRHIWMMRKGRLIESVALSTVSRAWQIVGAGDFTDDQRPDIVWQNVFTHEIVIWGMNGAQQTGLYKSLGSASLGWSVVGVADLNGDLTDDLLWQHYFTGQLVGWCMRGGVYLSSTYPGTVPLGWSVVEVADYNGDFLADFLLQQYSTGATRLWVTGGGIITPIEVSATPTSWRAGTRSD